MTTSAYDLASELTRRIETGIWREGERLPPERDLSVQFGMARNTVRRALKSLEDAGRLVRHVGRGTFVRGTSRSASPLADRIEQASPAEVMEVRLIFEPQAANLAAGRATAEELLAIERACANSRAAANIAEFERWDAELHLAIMRATRNALLIEYCQAIGAARQQPQWFKLKQRSLTTEARALYDRQHGAIVAAMLQRDVETARTAMQQHLLSVREGLLGL